MNKAGIRRECAGQVRVGKSAVRRDLALGQDWEEGVRKGTILEEGRASDHICEGLQIPQ